MHRNNIVTDDPTCASFFIYPLSDSKRSFTQHALVRRWGTTLKRLSFNKRTFGTWFAAYKCSLQIKSVRWVSCISDMNCTSVRQCCDFFFLKLPTNGLLSAAPCAAFKFNTSFQPDRWLVCYVCSIWTVDCNICMDYLTSHSARKNVLFFFKTQSAAF